jgi:hypothetical protein
VAYRNNEPQAPNARRASLRVQLPVSTEKQGNPDLGARAGESNRAIWNGGLWRQSGKHLLALSFSGFDPLQTSATRRAGCAKLSRNVILVFD